MLLYYTWVGDIMSRDEAIKYNSLYQEVELAISNIKNLGFEVKDFKIN